MIFLTCRSLRPLRLLQRALLACCLVAPVAATAAPAVHGLIVRLRDDDAAATPARATRSALHPAAAARWQALLADPALAAAGSVHAAPVGRAAARIGFPQALDIAEADAWIRRLAARPDVAWVEADRREPLAAAAPAPDDPYFAGDQGQWWLAPAGGNDLRPLAERRRGVPGVQTAWAAGASAAGVVVAVLDTGVRRHPDLDPARLLPGYDMVADWDAAAGRGAANDGDGRDADPTDPGDGLTDADRRADPARYGGCEVAPASWHGTAVLGMLAATGGNGVGVAGMLPDGAILPVRVSGRCGAQLSDIIDGMRWAAGLKVCRVTSGDGGCAEWAPRNRHPARVVNLSFGADVPCGPAYQEAIDELAARGVVVVAAAGNGRGAVARPANCRGVVGVAALNRDGFKATYSNFGPEVAIATVGGDDAGGRWGPWLADGGVLTLAGRGYARHVGTSFAAPLATGAVAWMLAADPAASVATVLDGLRASARPHVGSAHIAACSAANPGRCLCGPATCGAGILDATEALAAAEAHAAGRGYRPPARTAARIGGAELAAAAAVGPDVAAEAPASAEADGGRGGGSVDVLMLALLALSVLPMRRRWVAARRAD